MIRVRQIKINVNDDCDSVLESLIRKKLKLKDSTSFSYEISRKSIDARDKKNILFVYEVDVDIDVSLIKTCKDVELIKDKKYSFPKSNRKMKSRPIIIGSGPAGLFCSYMLAEAGYKPIIFERGEDIDNRVKTVEKFFEKNILDVNSNIQFGEGGAGTFSDGKLNTLTKDQYGRTKKIFEIFVENGAPKDILYMHNPHIGTDILRDVIKNMRNKIIGMGGSFYYRSLVTDLIIDNNKVTGVIVNNKDKYYSDHIVLAIGHSARDTFMMLNSKNIKMRPKNFAVGVRVEHPRQMIDDWQYGSFTKKLGSASYKLTYTTKSGRGVYSFCMCPGGYVVNASSEEGRLVVNGMSNHDRKADGSNSAIVVSVSPSDFGDELFAGMEFQRKLEEACYKEGKGLIPVQLYRDFCKNTKSTKLGKVQPVVKGNYTLANIRKVLPDFIGESIVEAMPEFGKRIKGFDRGDALFLGVETRTSSPIVIERDDTFRALPGLYPCGEGAGYAGGITTAAIDGVKVAEKIVLSL